MPLSKTRNLPKAVPVNDQKAPLAMRLAMSEVFILSIRAIGMGYWR